MRQRALVDQLVDLREELLPLFKAKQQVTQLTLQLLHPDTLTDTGVACIANTMNKGSIGVANVNVPSARVGN